ncbi:MAG: sulfatase family protein [Thermoguttaceae bacterium]
MKTHLDATHLLAAVLLASTAGSLAAAQPKEKPKLNVLFIMSDQHSARALGCYGNDEVQTPNLDRLASQGTRFERAFVQTGQCCPSRYSIWTGRYSRSHGLWSNGVRENDAETTVGELFKAAGYATANIGKHHMTMTEANGRHGFDLVVDMPEYQQFATASGAKRWSIDGTWLEGPSPGRANVGASDVDNDHHPNGFWASETIKFLREHKDRPFCVWFSFHGPHTPIAPSRPWAEMYDAGKLTLPPNNDYAFDFKTPGLAETQKKSGTFNPSLHRQTLAYYYGLVSQIDFNIGRVLDELDRLGLAENTIVVYTADHGEMMGEHGCWTKGTQGYDATLRVPLIVRLPGVVPAGQKRGELVESIDLLPTLLEAARLPVPDNVQGRSLLSLVGGQAAGWRSVAFSEIGVPGRGVRAITARAANEKYVVFREDDRVVYEQYFDREKDPWEMVNLAADPGYADAVERLRGELAAWEARTPQAAAPEPATKQLRAKRPAAGRKRKAAADRD